MSSAFQTWTGRLVRTGLLLAGAALASATVAAEPVLVAGVGVSLAPPETFVLARDHAGFTATAESTEIAISEPSAAEAEVYRAALATMDDAQQRFGNSWTDVTEVGTFEGAYGPIPYALARDDSVTGLHALWYALIEAPARPILVRLRLAEADPLSSEQVEAVLASAQVHEPPSREARLTNLPFVFEAVPPFRIGTVAGNNFVAMVLDGPQAEEPVVTRVAISVYRRKDANAESARRAEQFQLGRFDRDITQIVLVAGDEGWLQSGVMEHADHPDGLRQVQYQSVSARGTITLAAVLPEARRDEIMPTIEQIAQSLAWKQDAPEAALAEAIPVPGTGVAMAPPAGFEVSAEATGFVHQEINSNIVVIQMPAEAYAELEPSLETASAATALFRGQGIEVEAVGRVRTSGGDVRVLRGTQRLAGARLEKWIGITANEGQTVMVVYNLQGDHGVSGTAVLGSLASLQLGTPTDLADQVAALPFVIEIAEPFAPDSTLAGVALMLFAGGNSPDPTGARPVVVAEVQAGQLDQMLPDAALSLLRAVDAGLVADEVKRVAFAGAPGWYHSGTFANTGSAGGTLRIAQWVSVTPQGLIRLLARAPVEDFETLRTAIETMATSMAWKPQVSEVGE